MCSSLRHTHSGMDHDAEQQHWNMESEMGGVELLLCRSWISLQGGGVVVTNSAVDLAFHLIMCILSLLKTRKEQL